MVKQQDEDSPWQYNPDGKESVEALSEDDDEPAEAVAERASRGQSVSWRAPEFIEHHHPAGWYAALFITTIILSALIFLLTKDYFAAGTIAVLGIIVAVSAARKPDTASYELNHSGLSINDKKYPYSSFKSFSLIPEGDMTSVNFFPLKRFMPLVSIYLTKADEDKVTKAIADHLPYEHRQMDSIDRLSHRLRF